MHMTVYMLGVVGASLSKPHTEICAHAQSYITLSKQTNHMIMQHWQCRES